MSPIKTYARIISRYDNFLILGTRTFGQLHNRCTDVICYFIQRCHIDLQICNLFILVSSHGKIRLSIPVCIWCWIPNSCMFQGNARVTHSKFYTLSRMIRDGKCFLKLFDHIVSHRWMSSISCEQKRTEECRHVRRHSDCSYMGWYCFWKWPLPGWCVCIG